MVKKLIAGAALLCASLVVVAPAAHAASFAGVYPNHNAAVKACKQGVAQGRWYDTCVAATGRPKVVYRLAPPTSL